MSKDIVSPLNTAHVEDDKYKLVSTTEGLPAVRQAKEASLCVHGAKLFNLLPRHLRDISTGTVDQFKNQLDSWLQTIPDQPTVPGRQRAAMTNSLIDQVLYSSLQSDIV